MFRERERVCTCCCITQTEANNRIERNRRRIKEKDRFVVFCVVAVVAEDIYICICVYAVEQPFCVQDNKHSSSSSSSNLIDSSIT